jgi:acyl-CoA thioesterase
MTKGQRFIHNVGLKFDDVTPGRARCSLQIQDHHRNGTGVAHGGVLFTMADTAMGAALIPLLEKDQICATVEIKIGYFKPVFEGELVCEADVVNKGKNIASLEATVRQGEVLVSKASGTFAIFKRKPDSKLETPAAST